MRNPYQSRVNKGLECPTCKEPVEGYNLQIDFAFENFVRYRVGEYYILYPCRHPLPAGVEVYAEYIDPETKEVWVFDPDRNEILLVFLDIVEGLT